MAEQIFSGAGVAMDDDTQVKVRAGINVFEIHSMIRRFFSYSLMGPVDARVRENDTIGPMVNQVRHDVKWLTKYKAGVKFNLVDRKRGNCVCWMPDDPYWRNRVYLMDNAPLYFGLYGMHSRQDGFIPATNVKIWIDTMREFLKERTPIWKVILNGKERSYQWSEKAAQEEIEKIRGMDTKMQLVGQQMEQMPQKIVSTDIQPAFRMRYRPEIIKLILANKARWEFGWVQCPEFQANIRPAIEKAIQEKGKKDNSATATNLLREIVKMDENERKAIFSALQGEQSDPKDEAEPTLDSVSAPAAPVRKGGRPKTKKPIEQVS